MNVDVMVRIIIITVMVVVVVVIAWGINRVFVAHSLASERG